MPHPLWETQASVGLHLRWNACETRDQGGGEGGANSGEEDDVGFIDGWFYLSLGVGFAAGLSIPCIMLLVRKPWSDAYLLQLQRWNSRWLALLCKWEIEAERKSRSK